MVPSSIYKKLLLEAEKAYALFPPITLENVKKDLVERRALLKVLKLLQTLETKAQGKEKKQKQK